MKPRLKATQPRRALCFSTDPPYSSSRGDRGEPAGPPDASARQDFQVDLSDEHIGIDEYDIANQGLISHHFLPVEGRWTQRSIPFRYTWPAELDLMARLAGMTLRERWSGWQREPFTSESTKHVSVWQKPA